MIACTERGNEWNEYLNGFACQRGLMSNRYQQLLVFSKKYSRHLLPLQMQIDYLHGFYCLHASLRSFS